MPTDSWYDEIAVYNYYNPGFSTKTGHFTQVIWKDSIELGIGLAFSADNKKAWVVAQYYPAGNVEGEYSRNVHELCYAPSTASTTITATEPPTTINEPETTTAEPATVTTESLTITIATPTTTTSMVQGD